MHLSPTTNGASPQLRSRGYSSPTRSPSAISLRRLSSSPHASMVSKEGWRAQRPGDGKPRHVLVSTDRPPTGHRQASPRLPSREQYVSPTHSSLRFSPHQSEYAHSPLWSSSPLLQNDDTASPGRSTFIAERRRQRRAQAAEPPSPPTLSFTPSEAQAGGRDMAPADRLLEGSTSVRDNWWKERTVGVAHAQRVAHWLARPPARLPACTWPELSIAAA